MNVYALFDEEMHLLGAFGSLSDMEQTKSWWEDAGVKTLLWAMGVEEWPLYPGWTVEIRDDGMVRATRANPLVTRHRSIERGGAVSFVHVLAPTVESALSEARKFWKQTREGGGDEEGEKVSEPA